MAESVKDRTGFFVVKFGGRWFDVAMANGAAVLASAHDGGEIPWDAFAAGFGDWTNASPFPVPPEAPARLATTTNGRDRQAPPDARPKRRPTGDDAAALRVEEALELVDSIVDGCGQIPERGQEYAESVSERATDIGRTIEERQFVTDKQMSALENMLAGVNRWIER